LGTGRGRKIWCEDLKEFLEIVENRKKRGEEGTVRKSRSSFHDRMPVSRGGGNSTKGHVGKFVKEYICMRAEGKERKERKANSQDKTIM